ncbi:MAG TPA: non-homologous end-joining DNA ligase [Limnochordia bacterium]|nr:non-homologous end-joining DNA ligase [Limnochordia bacterium]
MTLTINPVEFAGRELKLTHLERVLWPERNLTKADLLKYYAEAAPALLPHLHRRPLTVTRHPQGIRGQSFYQKNTPDYAPEWIERWAVEGDARTIHYPLCEEPATLLWFGNQAAIGLHPWLSTTAQPAQPDILVFDLDPADGATFAQVRRVAALVRICLDRLGLNGFPKLSGATGVHIYVPIAPDYPYRVVAAFAGRIGEAIVAAAPKDATNLRRVRERTGRVYVDHLQNLPGKTIAAPFSVRPLPGAPVSMPVTWDEIDCLEPDAFKLPEAIDEVRRRAPLFAPVLQQRQSLAAALRAVGVERE